jgi:hypothetical protein
MRESTFLFFGLSILVLLVLVYCRNLLEEELIFPKSMGAMTGIGECEGHQKIEIYMYVLQQFLFLLESFLCRRLDTGPGCRMT